MRRSIVLFGALLVGALLGACLLPSFSDVLPSGDGGIEAAGDAPIDAPITTDDGGLDGSLVGCDDPTAVAIWPLTEGSGTTVHDCKGKYPGTITGLVAWGQGRLGLPALEFSGGSVSIADVPELRLAGPFTVTAWLLASSAQTDSFGDVVCRYRAGGQGVWALAVTPTPLVAELNVFGNTISQCGTGTAFSWAPVAGTYDPSNGAMNFYLSGNLKQSLTGPTMLNASVVPITFGANADGTSIFKGGLSQVRLYDRVLTAGEISSIATK